MPFMVGLYALRMMRNSEDNDSDDPPPPDPRPPEPVHPLPPRPRHRHRTISRTDRTAVRRTPASRPVRTRV